MKKMENKKNIIIGCLIGGLVVLAGVIFAITSNKELPELTTEEINLKESELVESLTGLKSTDDINTLVVSEPVMGSQALEVAVIKTKEKTDITSMMQNIKDNVDMSRWICVSAEKLYIVNSGDVLLVCKGSGYGKTVICDIDEAHIARQIIAIKKMTTLDLPYIGVLREGLFSK